MRTSKQRKITSMQEKAALKDDTKAILDDILWRWHSWARAEQLTPVKAVCAMFNGMRSPKQWDSVDDVLDGEINNKIMKAVDFAVSELKEPQRTAIHVNARNCATGRSIWHSPRLPTCPIERGLIVVEARRTLTKKLISAGVM